MTRLVVRLSDSFFNLSSFVCVSQFVMYPLHVSICMSHLLHVSTGNLNCRVEGGGEIHSNKQAGLDMDYAGTACVISATGL